MLTTNLGPLIRTRDNCTGLLGYIYIYIYSPRTALECACRFYVSDRLYPKSAEIALRSYLLLGNPDVGTYPVIPDFSITMERFLVEDSGAIAVCRHRIFLEITPGSELKGMTNMRYSHFHLRNGLVTFLPAGNCH